MNVVSNTINLKNKVYTNIFLITLNISVYNSLLISFAYANIGVFNFDIIRKYICITLIIYNIYFMFNYMYINVKIK